MVGCTMVAGSFCSRTALKIISSMSSLSAHVDPAAVAVARLLAEAAVGERLVDREGADIDEAAHLVLHASGDDVLQARDVLRARTHVVGAVE